MGYRELVKRVQAYSGLPDKEAEAALQVTVETLAVHLTEGERKDFASQLPQRLKAMALSVLATPRNTAQDIIQQFMELRNISEKRAKQQIKGVWRALKDAISPGEINDIRAQLPDQLVGFLK